MMCSGEMGVLVTASDVQLRDGDVFTANDVQWRNGGVSYSQ